METLIVNNVNITQNKIYFLDEINKNYNELKEILIEAIHFVAKEFCKDLENLLKVGIDKNTFVYTEKFNIKTNNYDKVLHEDIIVLNAILSGIKDCDTLNEMLEFHTFLKNYLYICVKYEKYFILERLFFEVYEIM